jgi:hypothetical protein
MTVKRILLIMLVILAPVMARSQPGNPPDPDDVVPISGIELLIGAGALLGGKRLYDVKRKS